MDWNGKTVFVTGATGFIGGRLCERLLLREGAKVRALVRSFPRAVRLGRFDVEMTQGDLTDTAKLRDAMTGCDAVMHCAFGRNGSPQEKRAATVNGTASVVRAAREAGVRRVVHVSTLSVYGDLTGPTLDETAPRRATGDFYTDTKIDAEQIALEVGSDNGPGVAIIQPTVVYGPFGGWWTQGQITRLKQGRFALPDEGAGVCNAVYVDDVVQAILLAAERDEAVGEALLISGPQPVSWDTFFAAFSDMLGRPCTVHLSVDEIKARHRKPGQPRTMVGWTLQVLRERPDVRQRLVNSPIIGLPYRVTSKLTPRGLLHAVKKRVLGPEYDAPPEPAPQVDGAQSEHDNRPIIVPDAMSLPQFTSRTVVSIDKARRLLGYEPAFNLSRGMALTSQWARWAGLLD